MGSAKIRYGQTIVQYSLATLLSRNVSEEGQKSCQESEERYKVAPGHHHQGGCLIQPLIVNVSLYFLMHLWWCCAALIYLVEYCLLCWQDFVEECFFKNGLKSEQGIYLKRQKHLQEATMSLRSGIGLIQCCLYCLKTQLQVQMIKKRDMEWTKYTLLLWVF